MVMVRRKRRKIIIIVSIVSVLLVGGAIGYWLFFGRSTTPLPKELIAQATFPIYYPEKLPEGYMLKAGSATGDSNAVYYILADSSGKHAITITSQAIPATFDAAKIMGSNPIPTTITPAGTLYNLSAGGSSKYMLNTGSTLLFITSPETINGKNMTAITSSLTEIK